MCCLCFLVYIVGACVNVLVNSDDLHGIFQDEGMKEAFAAYPELLCIDATYKPLELCLPLYIMLAEDGNGQCLCFPAAGGDRSFPLDSCWCLQGSESGLGICTCPNGRQGYHRMGGVGKQLSRC